MGNGILKVLKYIFECILEVIYSGEDKCPVCGNYTDNYPQLCTNCANKIIFCSETYLIGDTKPKIECFSTGYYSNVMSKLITNLKYKSDFISGEVLGNFLTCAVQKMNIIYDAICFVPCDKKVKKNRGFNQAEFLAKYIGKKLKLPVISCLKKIKSSKDQIGLGYKDRWQNIENCFIAYNEEKIKSKKIILVDDVLTTGATAYFCSVCLINKGAEKVFVLTAAKSKL